jgi:hypothetical protein
VCLLFIGPPMPLARCAPLLPRAAIPSVVSTRRGGERGVRCGRVRHGSGACSGRRVGLLLGARSGAGGGGSRRPGRLLARPVAVERLFDEIMRAASVTQQRLLRRPLPPAGAHRARAVVARAASTAARRTTARRPQVHLLHALRCYARVRGGVECLRVQRCRYDCFACRRKSLSSSGLDGACFSTESV